MAQISWPGNRPIQCPYRDEHALKTIEQYRHYWTVLAKRWLISLSFSEHTHRLSWLRSFFMSLKNAQLTLSLCNRSCLQKTAGSLTVCADGCKCVLSARSAAQPNIYSANVGWNGPFGSNASQWVSGNICSSLGFTAPFLLVPAGCVIYHVGSNYQSCSCSITTREFYLLPNPGRSHLFQAAADHSRPNGNGAVPELGRTEPGSAE